MDENQFQAPQPSSQSRFKKFLFFTEIGFFEVGFVVIFLGVVIGALQVFHVVDFSKYSLLLSSKITPLIPHFYSEGTAKKDLSTLLFPNSPSFMVQVKPDYLPSRDLSNVTITQKNTVFSATWMPRVQNSNTPKITGYVIYDKQNGQLDYSSIEFQIPTNGNDITKPIASESAKTIATSVLLFPRTLLQSTMHWVCSNVLSSFCVLTISYTNNQNHITGAYNIFVERQQKTHNSRVVACSFVDLKKIPQSPSNCIPKD